MEKPFNFEIMKTPNLLSGTAKIINRGLTEIIGPSARFDTITTALLLKPPGGDLRAMIESLWRQMASNWVEAKCHTRGKQNWRWNPHRDTQRTEGEVFLERTFIRLCDDSWANQIPTSSGLNAAEEIVEEDRKPGEPDEDSSGKGEGQAGNIDLAHYDAPAKTLTLVELKETADNPVAAAFQITRYALALVLARHVNEKCPIITDERWIQAERADLRVFAANAFYDRTKGGSYDLGWFEGKLDEAVAEFGSRHKLAMSFAFRRYDRDALPRDQDALRDQLRTGKVYSL